MASAWGNSPRGIAYVALVCLAIAGVANGEFRGKVVALASGNGPWWPNNVVVISMPSKARVELFTGKGMGPCFSPDGKKVAFINEGDSLIYTVPSDRSSAPVSTGIRCIAGSQHTGVPLYWLKLDNEMGNGEYIYFHSRPQKGWYRAKLGTTELEKLDFGSSDSTLLWGGISADGRRGGFTMPWRPAKADFVNKSWSWLVNQWYPGCNTSVSPSGKYFLHNSGGNLCYPLPEHRCSRILDWDTGQLVKAFWHEYTKDGVTYSSDAENHRWSHSDEEVVLWRDGNGIGHLIKWQTDERAPIGSFAPFDFFPDGGSRADTPMVADPEIAPGGSQRNAGQFTVRIRCYTPDAIIRYTTDAGGALRDETSGTGIGQSDSLKFTLTAGDTLFLKARAFRSGMKPSLEVTAMYTGPALVNPVTITYPNNGESFHVGDTLRVEWKVTNVVAGVDIKISLDEGRTWGIPLNETTVNPTDPSWLKFKWTIPDSIPFGAEGVMTSMVTEKVRFQVTEYGNAAVSDITDKNVRILPGVVSNVDRLAVVRGPAIMAAVAPLVYDLRGVRVTQNVRIAAPGVRLSVSERGHVKRIVFTDK